MSLRILFSLFLLFKLGASSSPERINPESNPFTNDLNELTGKKEVILENTKPAIRLPPPEDVGHKKSPGLTKEDLKLSILCSKGASRNLERCRSDNLLSLDDMSISSASTFNYEFDNPSSGSSGKPSQTLDESKTGNRPENENIGDALEKVFNYIDKNKKFKLEEIERRRKITPTPPKTGTENGSKKTLDPSKINTPFLKGISLAKKEVTSEKESGSAVGVGGQAQVSTAGVGGQAQTSAVGVGRQAQASTASMEGQAQASAVGVGGQAQASTASMEGQAQASAVGVGGQAQASALSSPPVEAGQKPVTLKRHIKEKILPNGKQKTKTPLPDKNAKKEKATKKEGKRHRFGFRDLFITNCIRSPLNRKAHNKEKQETITRPSAQTSPPQTLPPKASPPQTSESKPKDEEKEGEEKQSVKMNAATGSNKRQSSHVKEMIKVPASRRSSGQLSPSSQPQESNKIVRRSVSETPTNAKTGTTETFEESPSSLSNISSLTRASSSLNSMGSDSVFYSDSEYGAQKFSSDMSKDGLLRSQSSDSTSLLPKHPRPEVPIPKPRSKYRDPLEGMNIRSGRNPDDENRVYEKFILGKGLDKVIQKKLIDTYDSGDERVEGSVLEKIKDKITRKLKEAERKKEKSDGVPARMITRKDISKFSGPKKTEDLVEKSIELSSSIEYPEIAGSGSEMSDISGLETNKDSITGSIDREISNELQDIKGNIRDSINKYRDLEIDNSIESEERYPQSFKIQDESNLEPIQNPLEVMTYNDELKELKNAREDYFRNKFLKDLAEETKQEENVLFASQIAQKEALLRELEKISDELENKKSRLISEGYKKTDNRKDAEVQFVASEQEKQDYSEDVSQKDVSVGSDHGDDENELNEYSYLEGSLKLDEDAVIMGAERKEANQGIVILDPENANYDIYYGNLAEQDDGLVPIREINNEEEGLVPIQQTDKLSESEGLAPVGGFKNINELQAFEDQDRSMLPPPEESRLPYEEIYLTKHPELVNTDAVSNVKRENAIRKILKGKEEKGGVLRKREFENFSMSADAVERLKRNPFKTVEEKEKILRILRAKEELEKLRKEEKQKKDQRPSNEESIESSIDASELYPVHFEEKIQTPVLNRISDESLIAGDFEEESEVSETPGKLDPRQMIVGQKVDFSDSTATAASESEGSELAIEIGLGRLNAIRSAERNIQREQQIPDDHFHFPPYVRKRTKNTPDREINQR
ncbi:signal peptide containing protein [Cryptosporidium canis]|uniref:Signal peptide containing protein n=1 Tax=Cryptosporidium canis TaxID=195482 RepID=A0A9D5HWX0_9CRYT|nr:signal peptide containing protein [Cryptosporidium canis]